MSHHATTPPPSTATGHGQIAATLRTTSAWQPPANWHRASNGPSSVRLLGGFLSASRATVNLVSGLPKQSPAAATAPSGGGPRLLAAERAADQVTRAACADRANQLTEAEWTAVLPDVPYDPPCF
ncbi:hypothetical protein [Frankia sp. Cas4]|uniref:hypothetical protein n=1 Tax=Frankia sp. Cas4 TaxID=3073927 RepID=UPI002AD2A97C|nr:hypothetical protein [Frankia sp. Cas4]